VITIANTYAACIKKPAHNLMCALIAALDYIGSLGINVGNTFAKTPPTKDPIYWYMQS
jgi:hypothetical protein